MATWFIDVEQFGWTPDSMDGISARDALETILAHVHKPHHVECGYQLWLSPSSAILLRRYTASGIPLLDHYRFAWWFTRWLISQLAPDLLVQQQDVDDLVEEDDEDAAASDPTLAEIRAEDDAAEPDTEGFSNFLYWE